MEIEKNRGKVTDIKDVVVEVEFLNDPKPSIHGVLKLEKKESVILEVIGSSAPSKFKK